MLTGNERVHESGRQAYIRASDNCRWAANVECFLRAEVNGARGHLYEDRALIMWFQYPDCQERTVCSSKLPERHRSMHNSSPSNQQAVLALHVLPEVIRIEIF